MPPPRDHVSLAAAADITIFFLLATAIASVLLISGETVQVGRRGGPYTVVPKLAAQIGVLSVAMPLAGLVVARMVRGAYLLWATKHAEPPGFVLAPGEIIAWRGRVRTH